MVKPLPPAYRPLVLAGIEAKPKMPAKCRDCAFSDKGSPEQSDMKIWGQILRQVDMGIPFYCHHDMPTDETGAYRPVLDAELAPVDGFVCGGWIEMRARFLAVRRADLEDDLRGLPAEHPETFHATKFAIVFSAEAHRERTQ